MTEAPDYIDIELTDSDISDTVRSVLEAMTNMRREAIKLETVSEEIETEYLHHVFRLASGLEALADKTARQRMEHVAESFEANSELLAYDPLQMGRWEESQLTFVPDLEKLLITHQGESFNSTEGTYHIFQAIKYLALPKDEEHRQKILDSISIFQEGIPLDLDNITWKDLLAGQTYLVKDQSSHRIRMQGDPQNIGPMLKDLQKRGFKELHLEIPNHARPTWVLEGINYIETEDADTIQPPDSLGRRIAANAIKYTFPISLPIIGSLPRPFRKVIHEYVSQHYDKVETSSDASITTLYILGFGYWGLELAGFEYFEGEISSLISSYIISDSLLRSTSSSQPHFGNTFLEVVLAPIAALLKHKNSYSDGRLLTIDLEQGAIPDMAEWNPISYLEGLVTDNGLSQAQRKGKTQLQEKIWEYIEKQSAEGPVWGLVSYASKSDVVSIRHYDFIGKYIKQSALFFVDDDRYLITTIADGDLISVRDLSKIITENDPQNAVKTISNSLKPLYTNFRKYSAGELVADMEAMR